MKIKRAVLAKVRVFENSAPKAVLAKHPFLYPIKKLEPGKRNFFYLFKCLGH